MRERAVTEQKVQSNTSLLLYKSILGIRYSSFTLTLPWPWPWKFYLWAFRSIAAGSAMNEQTLLLIISDGS